MDKPEKVLEPTYSLSRTASWVIREKGTGVVIMETFDRKKVEALNRIKYEAIPIGDYLNEINNKIRLNGNSHPDKAECRKKKHPRKFSALEFDD